MSYSSNRTKYICICNANSDPVVNRIHTIEAKTRVNKSDNSIRKPEDYISLKAQTGNEKGPTKEKLLTIPEVNLPVKYKGV